MLSKIKMKIREYLRKGFSIITILVYSFVLLFQNFPFINIYSTVQAENVANKENIVLVLVDGNVYNSIKQDIDFYAGYIQRVNKNTKALVLPINTSYINAYDIQKIISNLYFNGEKTKTSFLKGIVLIGNIPLPVINNKGYIFTSIYPYVDIKDPSFIYNKGGYFVPSGEKSDVELIHGLIKFDNIDSYHKYFSKLKKYEENPSAFVEKKFYYDNFVNQDDSFNVDSEKYYINKLVFAENLVSKKITPLILEFFDKQSKTSLKNLNNSLENINNIAFDTFKKPKYITKGGFITKKLGFENVNETADYEKIYKDRINEYSKKIKSMIAEIDSIQNPYWLIPTLSLESSIKNFVRNYTSLFGSSYISNLDKNLQATGRYNWDNTISSLNTIDIKDELSVSYIYNVNKFLENRLDKQVDKIYKKYPIMVGYDGNNGGCYARFEAFWFGKNANDINSLSDIHIYRGTYHNVKNIEELSNEKTRGAKSVNSIMNNLFSLQTESNRGYDFYGKAESDGALYRISCAGGGWGGCTDLGRNGGEQLSTWAKRLFGGYSPLNIKISNNKYDPLNIRFNYENYKYAWHPAVTPNKNGSLFDLGGTTIVKSQQSTNYTDTINGIKHYASVWRTEHYTWYGIGIGGDDVCRGPYYDLGTSKIAGKYKLSEKKYIDTRVKHVSPTKEEFDKFNIGTPFRPVDSINYITFLTDVSGQDKTVRFDYPDIFQVNVYKSVGNKYVLKTPNEIKDAINVYLRQVVKNYNKKLSKNVIPEDYFIKQLGDEKISQIAEMLYYLNLGWKEKPKFNNLKEELDYLYKSFDINEKISYIVKNYVDTEHEYKIGNTNVGDKKLNFLGKPKTGYEAGMIISKNIDNVDGKTDLLVNNDTYLGSFINNDNLPLAVENQEQKECGRSLGEGVILWEWPAAFMCRLKETLKKPFKIGKSSACSSGGEDKTIGDNPSPDAENVKLKNFYEQQGDDKLQEYYKLKEYISDNVIVKTNQSSYLNDEFTGTIELKDYIADLGTFSNIDNALKNPISSVYIWSEKAEGNCLYIKVDGIYKNTCDGIKIPYDKWKLDFAFFNPQTGEGRYYAYKAGTRVLGLKFCTTDNVCYVKSLYFDKLAGPIKDVEIKPFSPVMIYGGENPVVILGYDAKKGERRYRNIVSYTPYNYNLYLDPPIGTISYNDGKTWRSKIDYNFDSTQKLILIKTNKTPISSINKFNLILKLDPVWGKSLENENIFKQASVSIGIAHKNKLNSSEVLLTPKNYKIGNDPYELVKLVNGIKTYDKTKLLKIHIEPKVNGKTLKTPVEVYTTNQFIVGTFKKVEDENSKGEKVSYDKFIKNNRFLILDDKGIDIYLLPTYKTGNYKITIKIPGMEDYVINGDIKQFPIDKLYVKLDKNKAKKGEIVKGTIYALDKFGNLNKLNSNNVKITTSSGINVVKKGNSIEVKASRSGFIQFEYNGKKQTIHFVVENSFLPLDKNISIMYLTLFGYDWGKYASSIMEKSNKNLAITTTLYDKNNIKHYDYVVTEGLKNQGKFISNLILKPNIFTIDLGALKLTYTRNIFTNPIKEVKSLDYVFSNGVYYIKEKTDDYITENKLENNKVIINGKTVIDFSSQTQNPDILIQYNSKLSKEYAVYNVFYKNRKIALLVFKGKILNVANLNLSKPVDKDIIYANGSTNGGKAIGISVGAYGPYKVLSPATDINIDKDNGIGFRSNFRNITDFAAGNNVGQSVKPFENELIINYGDPFVKRIGKEKLVSATKFSTTYGKRVFSSINGNIKKVISLDFNNDGQKDLLILYGSNKIRLLKNYKGYEHFENLGNLMILGKDVENMFAGDVDGDGYEDIYVVFTDKTVRVYRNNHGEFEVNGTPVCLPIQGTDGEHLSYSQIFFLDMNNDKKTDIVVNDNSSNIDVYFGPSYLSKDSRFCDANYKSRIIKKHVRSYKLEIDENKKFADAGYIYYDGIKNDSTLLQKQTQQAFKDGNIFSLPQNSNVLPENYLENISKKNKNKFAFQAIPKAIGPSFITGYDYIDFKKINFLDESDAVKVYKTMKVLSGNTLYPGAKVKVTVHIENPNGKKLTYLEVLKGPFSVISKDDKPIVKYTGIGKENITYPSGAYREFLFRVDNTNSKNIEISYYAYFLGQSMVKIKVGDWDKNNYGDIKVFLNNGCIKGYDYFQGEKGNPMSFKYSFVDLASKLRDFNNNSSGFKTIDNIKDSVQNGNYKELIDKYVKNDDNSYFDINTSHGDLNYSLEINGPDLSALKSRVNGVLKGLCNGFSFGKKGCTGSPIPCNYAFFAPGIINACGCPAGIDLGRPVFWNPGTKYTSFGPIPIPDGLLTPTPTDPLGPKSGVFPSTVRLYVAPTLTMGLGVAVCFGPYSQGMHSPSAPVGAIAGNCVVVAKDLSSSCKNINADDELDDWMGDLDNGICSQLPIQTGIFPLNPFDIENTDSFKNAPMHADISVGLGIDNKPIISFTASATKINSLADAEALMQGGEPLNLHIRLGTFKGIISCIVKKWMNHQIQFIVSQLTHMTVYVTYPDMSGLMEGFSPDKWKNIDVGGVGLSKTINSFALGEGNTQISKYLPSKQGLNELSNTLSNPFKAIKAYLEKIPFVNVHMKTVVIQVPWIGKDELERQIAYLENWLDRQKDVINSRKKFGNKVKKGDIIKVQKFVNSVRKNLRILKQYRQFPLKLYKYLHALDFYLDQVICIIKNYINLVVGWLNTQSIIFEKWVDAIVTLINVFKTWQLLIDVSVDWKSSCGKCRQDTGDLYDCTLMGLCPSLPVLPIPPFKIPDIYVDFTHIDLGLDIVLPKIKIRPVPVGMITLPDLPYVGGSIELPSLPILPAPPELPPLPELPPVPTVKLPNLPPPPKIPNLLPSLQVALNIFKIAGYFRCIIKNGIGLVAEWNVKTRIEQLTARHNQLFPFDFINIDFPELPFKGYDVKIDGYLRFRVEMKQLYEAVKKLADSINDKTKPMIGSMLQLNSKINSSLQDKMPSSIYKNYKPGKDSMKKIDDKFRNIENDWQKSVDNLYNYNPYIINDKPVETAVANKLLEKELKVFISQKGEPYLVKLPAYHFQTANKLLNDVKHKPKVIANVNSLNNIEKQIEKLVNKQHLQIYKIENAIRKLQEGKKVDTNSDIFVENTGNNLVSSIKDVDETITFKASLFSVDKKTLDIINSSKAPRAYYAGMYSKLLAKVDSKINHTNPYSRLLAVNSTVSSITSSSTNTKNQPILADPSQTIRGLYVKGTDNIYHNVLADKEKANSIRRNKTYFFADINNDGEKDLIWYDKNSVYIKYTNDVSEDNGRVIGEKYIYSEIIDNVENVVDKDGYLTVNGSKFKIWGKTRPINNLATIGFSPKYIKLKWRKLDDVNAYMIIYSSRIDVLNDIEKKFAFAPDFSVYGKTYKTYAVVIYDKKLGKIDKIKANDIFLNGHKVVAIDYIPYDFEDKTNFEAVFNKLFYKNNWKYFRVYTAKLDLKTKTLSVLSSYSNQDVGGKQTIADNIAPVVTVNLIRNKTHQIVGTGTRLIAYLNTDYTLKASWSDDVGVKNTYIADVNMNLLVKGNTLHIKPKQEKQVVYYYLVGKDYNGNIRRQKVIIIFTVPDIKIEKLNPESGEIITKIGKDMDISAIKYAVINGNSIRILKNIEGKDIFSGGVGQKIFDTKIFDNQQIVNLYNKKQQVIGQLNLETGIAKVDTPYYILGVVDSGTLYYNVYNEKGEKLFSMFVPVEKMVKQPESLNSSKYSLKEISNNNLGEFARSYCVYDKTNNICAMYISKKGLVYVEPAYRNKFIFTYEANDLGNISTTIYDESVPNPSNLTDDKKILYYIFKPGSFVKK